MLKTAKVAGHADALMTRTTGQRADIDGDSREVSRPPRHRSLRQGRTEERDDRHLRSRCHVQWAAVAADEECRVREKRVKLSEVELTTAKNLPARSASNGTGRFRDVLCGGALRGTRGDEDAPMAIAHRQACGSRRKVRRRPAAKGISGTDMQDDQRVVAGDTCRAKTNANGGLGIGVHDHLHRRGFWSWRCDTERPQQIELIVDRMPCRHERRRPGDLIGIGPAPSRARITDALPRTGGAGQPGAAGAAVEIDHQVESLAPERARKCHVIDQPPQAARSFDDDDSIEVRIVPHHWLTGSFDEVGNARVRIVTTQLRDGRSGEDHVANEAESDEQDLATTLRRPDAQGSTVASSINITGMSSLMG